MYFNREISCLYIFRGQLFSYYIIDPVCFLYVFFFGYVCTYKSNNFCKLEIFCIARFGDINMCRALFFFYMGIYGDENL